MTMTLCASSPKLHNPAERLAFPRKEQALPHVLNESEMARLIETPDTTTAIGLRDRALLETLYATGIRHAEAHHLDLYDIDTAAQRLTMVVNDVLLREQINTGYVAPLNQWTHLTITYNSGVVKTYINGALTHTYSGAGGLPLFLFTISSLTLNMPLHATRHLPRFV